MISLVLSFMKRFVSIKSFVFVLLALFLLSFIFYLKSEVNQYEKDLQIKSKQLQTAIKEQKGQIKNTTLKNTLEASSITRQEQLQEYLDELKDEIKKKEVISAKNKEPPDKSSNSGFTMLEF